MKRLLTSIITLGLLVGCGSRQVPLPIIEKKPQPRAQVKPVKKLHSVPQSKLPPAPKKKIKLKKVEDTNYSDTYMYPEDGKAAKKDTIQKDSMLKETGNTTSHNMTKEECISMISQEKFDRYTAMFGNETASIKRCAMIKAMKK